MKTSDLIAELHKLSAIHEPVQANGAMIRAADRLEQIVKTWDKFEHGGSWSNMRRAILGDDA